MWIRHKIQRVMLSPDRAPQDSDMPAVSDHLKWLEGHDIDAEVIRHTKMHKVLKALLKLRSIPRDEEFSIRARSMKLLEMMNGRLSQSLSSGVGLLDIGAE
jgi:hypothetical protein